MSTNLKLILFSLTVGLLFCGNLSAQNTGKLTGVVSDSTGGMLSSATVMLLKKTDSTLVEFALSENDGRLNLKKLA